MNIDRLPSGSYRIRKVINGKRRSITFSHKPTKKEIDQAIMEIAGKEDLQPVRKTFRDCAKEYIEINSNTLKPSTRRSYDTYTRSLSEGFLSLKLGEITQADVQAEINRYSLGRAPKSVSNAHGFISRVLTFFRPDMVLRTNLPAKQRYDKYVPSPEEVDAVLDCCREANPMMWGCYRLLLYGLRKGELIALTLEDLSQDNHIAICKAASKGPDNKWTIVPSPKTDASFRVIKIDQQLADFFRSQGFIYKGSPDFLYEYLDRTQKKLGQHHWRLHDFRAYMATELDKVLPEADVMAMGGWSSDYTMKQIYRRARIERNLELQDKAIEVLSRNGHEMATEK